jgi:transposase-like protein
MSRPVAAFRPERCPRTACRYHRCPDGWRWQRWGCYARAASPQRIQRFRCGHCGHTFSTQTFDPTYWLKRPGLLDEVFTRLVACSCLRQIARGLGCPHTTVMRQCARLARHALLYLTRHGPRGPVTERLVLDGFESFAYSQYHPSYLNLVVGGDSHYVRTFTESELRRKGAMTPHQRRRRDQLERAHGRPDPRAVEVDSAAALRLALPQPQAVVLDSDDHPAYPRALGRLPGWSFCHRVTSSRLARTAHNPLFPVNRLDLLLRHSSANHKRETIAFSKTRQGLLDRAAILVLWLNFVKVFSERRGGGTPAMRLGLRRRPESVRSLLRERLFPSLVELPGPWRDYYWRRVPTRELPRGRRHTLKLAT